jgi:hypothetical protein
MITAVDTTVLIDVFEPDPTFGPRSREALRAAIADGSVIACEMVWAEVAATFPSGPEAEQALQRLGIDFSPIGAGAAVAAGVSWRSYRRSGGPRTRLIADFFVGAHAKLQADRLLTRDRGFYRTYFKELRILDPSASVRRGKDDKDSADTRL